MPMIFSYFLSPKLTLPLFDSSSFEIVQHYQSYALNIRYQGIIDQCLNWSIPINLSTSLDWKSVYKFRCHVQGPCTFRCQHFNNFKMASSVILRMQKIFLPSSLIWVTLLSFSHPWMIKVFWKTFLVCLELVWPSWGGTPLVKKFKYDFLLLLGLYPRPSLLNDTLWNLSHMYKFS